jgi:O-antigen ligase
LAAFGGVYGWSVGPVLAGAIALTALTASDLDRSARSLDVALAGVVGAVTLQLVPLPTPIAAWLSPGSARITAALALDAPRAWLTLTIDPADTVYALAVCLSAVLTFVACRSWLAHRGVREVCRIIAWLGLLLASAGMVQRAASGGRIYGFWTPLDAGALPFGPFINRNHAATWLVMGASVTVGYLMARLHRPGSDRRPFFSVRQSADSRTVWLAIAGTTMVIGIGVSLSRSGALALAAAAAVLLAAGRRRLSRFGTVWAVGVSVIAGAVLVTLGQFAALLERVANAAAIGRPGRLMIWQDTLPAARDFWLTGSGAGTYTQLMIFYQTADRAYYFNQAHNHYLQVLAEGGVLLGVPVVLAVTAFVRLAARRLRDDRSGVFWIRVGSAAGLAAVALQSGWETGLRLPANAELAAVLAALVLHPVTAAAESPRA